MISEFSFFFFDVSQSPFFACVHFFAKKKNTHYNGDWLEDGKIVPQIKSSMKGSGFTRDKEEGTQEYFFSRADGYRCKPSELKIDFVTYLPLLPVGHKRVCEPSLTPRLPATPTALGVVIEAHSKLPKRILLNSHVERIRNQSKNLTAKVVEASRRLRPPGRRLLASHWCEALLSN